MPNLPASIASMFDDVWSDADFRLVIKAQEVAIAHAIALDSPVNGNEIAHEGAAA